MRELGPDAVAGALVVVAAVLLQVALVMVARAVRGTSTWREALFALAVAAAVIALAVGEMTR